MNLSLNSEQSQLRDTLQSFLRDRYPLASRTAASGGSTGWRPEIWRSLGTELGILGAAFPEEAGGSGGGAVEHMVIMEELGAALTLEPYLESVVMAGGLLRRVPGTQASDALKRILAGEDVVSVAWLEPDARFALSHASTTAKPSGSGWRIDGHKVAVVGAGWGTQLLVTARTSGASDDTAGLSIFLIDRETPGVKLREFHTLDGRRAADVVLDGVNVSGVALLGQQGEAYPLLEQVFDETVAAQCAEALGLMRQMLHDTVEYTKQRKQFGQRISSFQALQHRMADMLMQLELARSATYGATLASATDVAERAMAASAAKVTVDEALRFVSQNAVQLHGGMGMSDETPVTHYFRRATVIRSTLGSHDHHLARFARLEGRSA